MNVNTKPMIDTQINTFLLPAMFNAAVRAGAAIMKIHGHKDDYDITLKSDKTPITMADRSAHRTIREALGHTRIPILSEEGREMRYDERRNWELYWLVDPLDGTAEFIEGYNEFTVNIALMENNCCIAAVIYVPYFEKMYIAGQGRGAAVAGRLSDGQNLRAALGSGDRRGSARAAHANDQHFGLQLDDSVALRDIHVEILDRGGVGAGGSECFVSLMSLREGRPGAASFKTGCSAAG